MASSSSIPWSTSASACTSTSDPERQRRIVRRERMAWAARALTAGLLLAALGAISACADRPGAAAPITLVFKHAHILGPGNPIPRLIAEFEARHPGVHVQAEALPWNSDEQRQFFVINLEGDSPGFDVMMLDVIWVPEFARAGWLLDLTAKLAPDELAAFFPSTVEAATYGGRVWGMPWNMNVGLLYYRRDLLDKYGLSAARDVDGSRGPGRAHPRRRAEPAARRRPLAGQAVRGPDGERPRGAVGRRHRARSAKAARSSRIRRARRRCSPSCGASSRAA